MTRNRRNSRYKKNKKKKRKHNPAEVVMGNNDVAISDSSLENEIEHNEKVLLGQLFLYVDSFSGIS